MTNECKHGQLARQCELCEKDQRIAELEKALRELRGELEAYAGLRAEYQDWSDAFGVIDKALGL